MLDGGEVMEWAVSTFGKVAMERRERAMRLLEEAMELAQCERVGPDTATIILERVYQRPPGDVQKEIGQVQMTLTALAENLGHNAMREGEREFDRVKSIPQEEWDRRHKAKVAIGMAQE